jgi:hypothetical protein
MSGIVVCRPKDASDRCVEFRPLMVSGFIRLDKLAIDISPFKYSKTNTTCLWPIMLENERINPVPLRLTIRKSLSAACALARSGTLN